MSNQASNLDLIAQNQSAKEQTANALFDAASPATTLGRRLSNTAGMVWGYYGGIVTLLDGSKISLANDTKTLTPSTTNYLVIKKSDGVVSVSSSITNWNDTTNYSRLYLITTDASKVADYNDYRSVFYTSVASGSAAAPITVDDEGGQITAGLTGLNFAGAGVTATAAGGAVTVTIPGGGGGSALEIDDEGTPLTTGATKIDFVGAGVTSTNVGGAVTVTIPGGSGGTATPVEVADEGVMLTTIATKIDFVGAGVTATHIGGDVTVTIPGGGSGGTPQVCKLTAGTGQVVPKETSEIVSFSAKAFDVGNIGSTSTHRIQPTVAGYYIVEAHAKIGPAGTKNMALAVGIITVNSVSIAEGCLNNQTTDLFTQISVPVSAVVYMNGTTDYIQFLVYFAGTAASQAIQNARLSAVLVSSTVGTATVPDTTVNVQTASYTPVLADKNAYIVMDVATANNFTVPPNASVAYPAGANLHVRQRGLGQTTLVAGVGVTINTPETLKTRKQNSTITLIQTEVLNVWDVMGDLELLP